MADVNVNNTQGAGDEASKKQASDEAKDKANNAFKSMCHISISMQSWILDTTGNNEHAKLNDHLIFFAF